MLLDAHTADEQLDPAAPLTMLLEHFDLIVQTPADVDKLDAAILQLAVEGKLVAQDPSDEPVQELIAELFEDKRQLLDDKIIGSSADEVLVDEEVITFNIPNSWKWVAVADVCYIERGITFPASAKSQEPADDHIACLRTANVQSRVDWDDLIYVPTEHLSNERKIVALYDILISMANSYALVGKVSFVDHVPMRASFGGFIAVIRCLGRIDPRYVYLAMSSPYFQQALRDSSSQTTNIANISLGRTYPLPFPLPPLAEQKRIVARVDELRRHTAALRAELAAAAQDAVTVNNAALNRLHTAAAADAFSNGKAFAAAWQTLRHAFDPLYSVPQNLTALRQTILQLAVQGKLVPQDPNDEPAVALLKRIQMAKTALAKDGVIPRQKTQAQVDDTEAPYAVPPGWIWCRWNDASMYIADVDHKMPEALDSGVPYISPKDFTAGNGIDFSSAKKISSQDFTALSRKIKPEFGDIIFPRYGTIGVNRLVEVDFDFLASYSCAIVKTMKGYVVSQYAYYYSLSPLVQNEIQKYINKTTQPNVGIRSIQDFLFPLPPLAEQKRIVACVDELLALCDLLEAELTEAEAVRVRLVDAILAGV